MWRWTCRPGASPERTREALKKAEAILASEEAIKDSTAILGFSIFYRYANQAFVFTPQALG